MNWHTATIPTEQLSALLATIQAAGGTIVRSMPGPTEVRVTWTTASSYLIHEPVRSTASAQEPTHGVRG